MSDPSASTAPSATPSENSTDANASATAAATAAAALATTVSPVSSVYESLGKGKVMPVWVPDGQAKECVACGVSFGLLTRKHHCRCCGQVVCSSDSRYKARLPAFANDLVRICCECQIAIGSAQRGISVPRIRQFITASLSDSNVSPVEKSYAQSKLTEIQKLIHADEKKIFESPPTDSAELEKMKMKMLKMAEDAGRLQEDINKLRISEGLVVTVVLSEKLAIGDPQPSQHRLLVVTPGPARLLGISSLIYPSISKNSAERESHQIRFRLLRGIDEIATIKPVDFTLNKGQIGKGIQITWANIPQFTPPTQSAPLPHTNTQGTADSQGGLPSSPSLVSQLNEGNQRGGDAGGAGKDKGDKDANKDAKLLVTQFLLVDTHEMTVLEKVEIYMKKLETQRAKMNKRGSIGMRTEFYDAKIMETLKEMKETKGGKEKEKSSAPSESATSNSLDIAHSPFSLQSETLQTLHALVKEHLHGVKSQIKMIDGLLKDMKTEVDWANEEHADLLKRLYSSWTGSSEFPGEKSEKWKSLGFQGLDPQTDFRGMGLLALKCLVWAGESYPKDMQLLVNNQSERDYPLATAGINLVAMVADLLTINRAEGYERPVNKIPLFRIFCRHGQIPDLRSGTTTPAVSVSSSSPSASSLPLPSAGSPPKFHPFAELIANLLPLLDHLFVTTNATYFTFPSLLQQIRERIIGALASNPCSFKVFIKMIHQEDLGVEDAVDFMLPKGNSNGRKVPGDREDGDTDELFGGDSDNKDNDVQVIGEGGVETDSRKAPSSADGDGDADDWDAQTRTVLTHRVTIAGNKLQPAVMKAKIQDDEEEGDE